MVPDTGDEADGPAGASRGRAGDDHRDPGFDEVVLYGVIRKAVEDAVLGVIGTLLLVGVAFVLVAIGVSAAVQTGRPLGLAFGVVAVLFGGYLAASTLELVPPAREWF